MKPRSTLRRMRVPLLCLLISGLSAILISSSHREAPLIADDPLADNTDVYAFKSPNDPNKIILIANYIPLQLPDGGPNYYHFGENIRYEIHIDNNVNTPGDDLTYRWTFTRTNQDPTTFFNIRLGKENLKTTYTLERSKAGGPFQAIVTNGVVPPYNVGPRSITSPVGLNAPSYESLMNGAIMNASTGERVFAGPVDDPFFVDAGGIFDLGDAPRTTGTNPQDLLRYKNVHTLALEVDVATLQKDGKSVSQAANILDGDFVIGVWASASRRKMRVLNGDGTETHSGEWVQVSRLGMPLTNEVINPIGFKDKWNSMTPYEDRANVGTYGDFYYKPELALYIDETFFGSAVPALAPLDIQRNSLGMFGFGNDQNGLFPLKGSPALNGTALAESAFGSVLLPGPNKPRSVDLYPIFNYGVPNLRPYQLATGKGGDPLAAGKPFINNFLPNGGDMLRLNMAVPATPRNSADFSSEGLVQAAVLGLVDSRFNASTALQFIPNMDGFPNGRRLEDDVTRIELQAVSGIVLAAIGLFYDDYVPPTGRKLRFVMEFDCQTCPAGYGLGLLGTFNGHAYYLSEERYTWTQAKALAMARGGYITTISSQAENNFVRTFVLSDIYKNDPSYANMPETDRGIWIGLNDATTEGTYMWVNGEPVTYTNWAPGQPSASTPDEDYVAMQFDGKWNDLTEGGSSSPVTPTLLSVLNYHTGINRNDTTFKTAFPFEQTPWPGNYNWMCNSNQSLPPTTITSNATPEITSMNMRSPEVFVSTSPNPIGASNTLKYRLSTPSHIQIVLLDASGKATKVLVNKRQDAGTHTLQWNANGLSGGVYYISASKDGVMTQSVKLVKN